MFSSTKEKKVVLTADEIKSFPLIMTVPPAGNIHCDRKKHYVVKDDNDSYWISGDCTCIK